MTTTNILNHQSHVIWDCIYHIVRTVGIDRDVVEKYVRDQWKKDKYIDGDQLDLRWN